MSAIYKMISDIPHSEPLEKYRNKASFDWKRMKLYLEGETFCKKKLTIFSSFISHPELMCDHEKRSMDELIHQNYRRFKLTLNVLPPEKNSTQLLNNFINNVRIFSMIDSGLTFKRFLNAEVCSHLLFLSKHDVSDKVNGLRTGKYHSCISLTEIGHGSNLSQLQTTASYDKDTDSFIINSPSVAAWKCWSGNLGVCATHVALVAKLYTPDGQCHGLNWFFTPIRNPRTLQSYPGVLVGNIGRKVGLNSVDNGFLAFTNYRIPRNSLINFISDVTPDGQFTTLEPDPKRRFAMVASTLNITRFGATALAITILKKGLIIAIRYAAVRKQFGPKVNSPEMEIIEYPLHQYRLMPYLCASIVYDLTYDHFFSYFTEIHEKLISNKYDNSMNIAINSLHPIAVGLKVIISWTVKHGLQEVRDCCGGHGYLIASGIGDLFQTSDSLVTLEGDNNILVIHINKILLTAYNNKIAGNHKEILFGLFDFLNNLDKTLATKCTNIDELSTPAGILKIYNWLNCYLIHQFTSKISQEVSNGVFFDDAFNKIQSFYGISLAMAFVENLVLQKYFHILATNAPPRDCAPVLVKVGMLFAMWSLERYLLFLHEGNYFADSAGTEAISKNIADLCLQVKDESIALIDAIAPPDGIMNSLLGSSDGEVYKRLVANFMTTGNNLQRPHWWKEMCLNGNEESKL